MNQFLKEMMSDDTGVISSKRACAVFGILIFQILIICGLIAFWIGNSLSVNWYGLVGPEMTVIFALFGLTAATEFPWTGNKP